MSLGLDAVGVRNDDCHRGVGVVGEVLAQLVADLVCRGGLRQHPVVGKAPPHAEERRAEQQEQRDTGQPDGNGTVHGACRAAIPEPLLDGDRRRLGPAEHAPGEPTDVQRIQPVTDEDQSCGGHHDGGGGGECDGGDPGVGERLQEVHGEQHQHHHRQRHGGGGEHDGSPGRQHHSRQGDVSARAVGQLVAIPADHQQRVVDRQRQAHRRCEVEREDRHVGGEGDDAQHRERAQDRHATDGDRQRCGQLGRRTPRPGRESSAGSRSTPSRAGLAATVR